MTIAVNLGSVAPSQSLLHSPFLEISPSLPPSLCPQVSRHFLPGCKAGGLAAPKCPSRQAFPFPSIWTSGTEAASPTQSLVSLPKCPWQIQFQAASRHMLCTLFYLRLALRALESVWLGSPFFCQSPTCMRT